MKVDQYGECAAADGTAMTEGRYANYMKVGMNATEFVVDFGQHYASDPRPRFHSRIVTTPTHMRAFVGLLQRCLADYENEHGAIVGLPDGEGH